MGDICSPQNENALSRLDNIIRSLESQYDTVPRLNWPECPADDAPPKRMVEHPYFKDVWFRAEPMVKSDDVKVTVDGRQAEYRRSRYYEFQEPPLGIPPWYKPRSKSVEIRGGVVMNGCDCWKKNGLQDDCHRWDCARPECLTRPLPECPPGNCPPITGVRKMNAYMMHC
ncbi:uncharacterized protein LOC106665294 [Cimex lectularius]|uniref:Uncharacterized protein n=1 Tax=Cimex lectularius TaxID=79782 RepID=A0A8I6RLE6_CIMLE|nr:uncharacterized protein LOC106665294 [Cimex lectularius]